MLPAWGEITTVANFQDLISGHITQGTGYQNRIGNKIFVKYLVLTGVLRTEINTSYESFRIWVGLASRVAGYLGCPSTMSVYGPLTNEVSHNTHWRTLYQKRIFMQPDKANADLSVYGVHYRKVQFKVRVNRTFIFDINNECGYTLCVGVVSDSTITPHPGFDEGQFWIRYTDV